MRITNSADVAINSAPRQISAFPGPPVPTGAFSSGVVGGSVGAVGGSGFSPVAEVASVDDL